MFDVTPQSFFQENVKHFSEPRKMKSHGAGLPDLNMVITNIVNVEIYPANHEWRVKLLMSFVTSKYLRGE